MIGIRVFATASYGGSTAYVVRTVSIMTRRERETQRKGHKKLILKTL